MSSPSQESAADDGRAGKLAVLVADDAHDLQDLMALWLEEAGHQVTRVSNGRDVVRLIGEQSFDLVITDIIMPDGDGWDAIADVHRLRPETRILAISGGAREIPASACLRVARGAGAVGQLKKPFNRVDFMAAIAAVMR